MAKSKDRPPLRSQSPITDPGIASPARQEWADRITKSYQSSVEAIIETGHLLIEAQDNLDHGEWTPMVEKDLPFGLDTAEKLMKIARHFSKSELIRNLPNGWGTLIHLTRLPLQLIDRHIDRGIIRPDMTQKDAAALVAAAKGNSPKKRTGKGKRKPVPAKPDPPANDDKEPDTSLPEPIKADAHAKPNQFVVTVTFPDKDGVPWVLEMREDTSDWPKEYVEAGLFEDLAQGILANVKRAFDVEKQGEIDQHRRQQEQAGAEAAQSQEQEAPIV
jgi:Protein of unknown function (DUF3102)